MKVNKTSKCAHPKEYIDWAGTYTKKPVTDKPHYYPIFKCQICNNYLSIGQAITIISLDITESSLIWEDNIFPD